MRVRRAAVVLALALLGPATLPSAPRWLRVETEHFLIVYQPSEQEEADELLALCEDVYQKVTGFFGSFPSKVPCILHGNMDAANGSTSPFPARIDLVVTAPSDHSMGARSESWLRILLTHELTHYVHLTMDRGVFAALSRLFGRDVAMGSALFLPGWMAEGPTTNLETLLTEGGRGRSALFEMYSKAPIVEGNARQGAPEGDLFSLRQAGYDSAFPPAGRIYVAGYILVDYLLDTFGPDSFTRIMDAYLAFPFFGPWAAIQKVTGKKALEVFTDMKAGLAAAHGASAGIRGGARITPERVGDYHHPQPTARGLYLYRRSPEKAAAIVRHDPATGEEEILVRADLIDESSFCATADGQIIYFTSLAWDWRKPGMGEAVSDLHRLDRRTGRVDRLTRDAHLWQPAVSADGMRLAAVQGNGSHSRLVTIDPGSGAVRELYAPAGASLFTPTFSPDGHRLAFTVNVRGFQDIGLLALGEDGPGEARLLTGPDADGEYYPSFLPDGRVLFSSDRTGSLSLYSVDPDTGDLALIVEDPISVISAVADGARLLYSSYSSTGYCIKQIAMEDLEPLPLPPPPPGQVPPAAERSGSTGRSRPYSDIPLPYLWFPWLAFGTGVPGGIDAGIGARALGGSLLGISSWSAIAAWHPLASQPRLALEASTALGSLLIDGTLRADYGFAGTYQQDFAGSVQLSYPLAWGHSLGTGFALVARTRLTFDTFLEDSQAFDFGQGLSRAAADWNPSLWIAPGIALRWQAGGAPRDFYPPWDLAAALDVAHLLPAFPAVGPSERLTLFLSASLPSAIPHHVVRVGAKASWTTGTSAAFLDSFVAPRGAFSLPARDGPGLLLGSIDYLVPAALLDAPIVLGLGLTGIGLGVHVEWGGQFGVSPSFFLPDGDLYAGVELTLQFTAGITEVPVGLGLSARIDTAGGVFDPGEDLRPYIFLSFDSFRDAARETAIPTRTRLP